MDDFWKVIAALGALGTIVTGVAVFHSWHSKAYNVLKDEIHELKLKIKDLEHKDDTQQTIIDQFPDMMPLLHRAVEQIVGKKGK